MITIIKKLEIRVEELEKEVADLRNGMAVFNVNFMTMGNVLAAFDKSIRDLEEHLLKKNETNVVPIGTTLQ